MTNHNGTSAADQEHADLWNWIPLARLRGFIVVEPGDNLFDRFAYKPTYNTECIRTSMFGYDYYGGATRLEIRTACVNELGMAHASFNTAWSTLIDSGAIRESSKHPGRFVYQHTNGIEHEEDEE